MSPHPQATTGTFMKLTRSWINLVADPPATGAQQQHVVPVSGDRDGAGRLLPGTPGRGSAAATGDRDRARRLLPGIPGPVQGYRQWTQQLFRIHRDLSRGLLRGTLMPDTDNGDTGPGHIPNAALPPRPLGAHVRSRPGAAGVKLGGGISPPAPPGSVRCGRARAVTPPAPPPAAAAAPARRAPSPSARSPRRPK
ncbi:putative uncharacterized protein FLJ46214 [Melospiza melodia melodia]|uniref:putative uncharacterized protein FLJ46214 n=1 Tax=Melospiza melodia melodia TaxID=1914991 RepID=UPI002FCFDAB4